MHEAVMLTVGGKPSPFYISGSGYWPPVVS